MSDIAIHVEHLSKAYRLTHQATRARYKTLRDDLVALPRRLTANLRGENNEQETFWALEDVSFDVHEGAVVGIIGRNGAGKSTLLKILSRITEPTRGRAELYGRVGSLLEVGTGFHPELTGRENIYLSGAVLGMTRAEVQRKFDEIVAFAEVEKFLDTPAKHYSSGMYVRLAFAVAAHLEPEILIVDEVLAVGDAEFQRKSLGKMGDVAKSGRTVLFVSHNLGVIQTLCQSSFLIDRGRLIFQGTAQAGVATYIDLMRARGLNTFLEQTRRGDTDLRFERCYLSDDLGQPVTCLQYTTGGKLVIEYQVSRTLRGAQVAFELWHVEQGCILSSTSLDRGDKSSLLMPGRYRAQITLPALLLRPGTYWITVSASLPGVQLFDEIDQACQFEVTDDGSPVALLAQGRRGAILPILEWNNSILT